jgi:hypothetical protein
MAGLSNFISNEAVQSTSMPSWFDTAQQNVVNQATTAAGNVPSLQNTVAGTAINQLGGAQNPFTQAQGTLNQIASGAANPWLVSNTGQVTPNTATPLGGLFQAQNQELQQLMPQYTAPVQGGNIASGNFGSLRGQTAVNKAMADAQSKLFSDQMQAALQAQGVGAQAAGALGQVGSQGVQSMTSLGQAQQSDPFFASSALGKILGGMQIPTTTKNVTNLSPLNQIGSVVSALGGSISGTDKLLKDLGLGGLSKYIKAAGSGSYAGSNLGAGLGAGTYDLAESGGKLVIDSTGNRMITNPDGSYQTFDKNGTLIDSGNSPTGGNTDEDSGGGGNIDTGGGGGGGGDTGGGGDIDWDADQGGGNIDFDWGGGGGVIDTGTGEDWGME